MGLDVVPPDVNESAARLHRCTPSDGRSTGKVIRFGLGAVKGVGEGAVEAILEARERGRPFALGVRLLPAGRHPAREPPRDRGAGQERRASTRIAAPRGRSRAPQLLARARRRASSAAPGAARPAQRADVAVRAARAAAPAAAAGASDRRARRYPEVEAWTPKQLLAFEKEALGFYISGPPARPLPGRPVALRQRDHHRLRRGAAGGRRGGGRRRGRPTASGRPSAASKLAFFQLEDQSGQLEVVVFPKTFEKVRPVLVSDEPLLCTGKVQNEGRGEQHAWRMLLEDAVPLAELRKAEDQPGRDPPRRRRGHPGADQRPARHPRAGADLLPCDLIRR